MLAVEYDEAKIMELFKEEGREQGREEGREQGREQGKILIMKELVNDKTLSISQAAKKLNMSEDELKKRMEEI